MKKLILFFLLITTVNGQEIISLTTPIVVNKNSYHVGVMRLEFDNGILSFTLLDNNNSNAINCAYTSTTNPTGIFLLTALQKANLSAAYVSNATTGSLKQRVYHRLIVMNEISTVCNQVLVGTLTGSIP